MKGNVSSQSLDDRGPAAGISLRNSAAAPCYVFAGGGTLGHLLPGLALADELGVLQPDAQMTFIGRSRADGRNEREQSYVTQAGYDYRSVPCEPAPRLPWRAPRFVGQNLRGFLAARSLLAKLRPKAVIGLGGYVSAPAARAAVHLGLPLVLMEQNVVPGRANRWLAPTAQLICAAWQDSLREFPAGARCCVTGIPLRTAFGRTASQTYAARPRRLLVLGGTAGARSLNEAAPHALARLGDRFADWEVLHQAGDGQAEAAQAIYDRLRVPARVVPRIADMAAAMASASFAICRAGGATLAELAASGLPALLIPYPRAADNHQCRNARALVTVNGCLLLEEQGSVPLVDRMTTLLNVVVPDAARRAVMAAALIAHARPHAGRVVAELILDLVCRQSERRSFAA